MANIGATTAFYKVETSLTRANSEVSKSMERLATGKQNANAGDRSSYVAMSDTFRLDYVGTKAGIKGASVVMGYLETGMRTLDAASGLLSRLQELAVLGSNNTNTTQDHEAINLEAEAIADEFNRLMTTSTYKGKDVFVNVAASERVALGGRAAEMSFGIGKVSYTELYGSTARTIVGAPNDAATFNLAHLPSDAVVPKAYGAASAKISTGNLDTSATYVIKGETLKDDKSFTGDANDTGAISIKAAIDHGTAANQATVTTGTGTGSTKTTGTLDLGDMIVTKASTSITITNATPANANLYAKVRTDDNKFVAGETYVVYALGDSDGNTGDTGSDAAYLKAASADLTSVSKLAVGTTFKVDTDATALELARINSLVEGITFTKKSDVLTKDIEAIQAKINTARVQAGSQYAAIESSIAYTTDLTAQYELGYNTVSDVNFSMETAHLAKNQILQQAATAMLAQANQGQSSLLQLIQG